MGDSGGSIKWEVYPVMAGFEAKIEHKSPVMRMT